MVFFTYVESSNCKINKIATIEKNKHFNMVCTYFGVTWS